MERSGFAGAALLAVLLLSGTAQAEPTFKLALQGPGEARTLDTVTLVVSASWTDGNNTTAYDGNVTIQIVQGADVLHSQVHAVESGILLVAFEVPCSRYPDDVTAIASLTTVGARHEAQARIRVGQSNRCAQALDDLDAFNEGQRIALRDSQSSALVFGTLVLSLFLGIAYIASLQHRWATENQRLSVADRIALRAGFRWTDNPMASPSSTHMAMTLERYKRRLRIRQLNTLIATGRDAAKEKARHEERVAMLSLHINEERMNKGQAPERDYR